MLGQEKRTVHLRMNNLVICKMMKCVCFQTLLQYASNKNASEHIVYLLEVYRLAIQSFASARPFLTTECEDVLLVLGRLVL